jgi:uncharacterized membrane protein
VLCSNGHNNVDTARFCTACGVNTFTVGSTIPASYAGAAPPTNGYAVASMVLGICGCVGLFFVGPILALVFGHRARREIANTGHNGSSFASAGIVLGWVGLTLNVVVIVGYVVIFIFFLHIFGHCPFSNPTGGTCPPNVGTPASVYALAGVA